MVVTRGTPLDETSSKVKTISLVGLCRRHHHRPRPRHRRRPVVEIFYLRRSRTEWPTDDGQTIRIASDRFDALFFRRRLSESSCGTRENAEQWQSIDLSSPFECDRPIKQEQLLFIRARLGRLMHPSQRTAERQSRKGLLRRQRARRTTTDDRPQRCIKHARRQIHTLTHTQTE